MGGSVSPDPAESKQKLFTFDDNGPSIILTLPNSSNIAIIGFPTEHIFSFSDTLKKEFFKWGLIRGY